MMVFTMQVLLQVFFVCTLYVYGNAKECGGEFSSTGTLLLPENLQAGDNCTWTIKASSNKTMGLHLSDVLISADSTFILYDGPASDTGAVVMNLSGIAVTSEVAVVFAQQATIVLTVTKNQTNSKGLIYFNTDKCSVNLSNSLALTVKSPIAAPPASGTPARAIQCSYQVANELPMDKVAVISFLAFNLDEGSNLLLVSGPSNQTYAGGAQIGQQPDFFTLPDSQTTQVTFLINQPSAAKAQSFSLAFQPFNKACTLDQDLGDAPLTLTAPLPATPGLDYRCRWRITASQEGASTLMASVNALDLSAQDGLTLVAGQSSLGAPVDRLAGAVSTGYLVVSPSPSLVATLTLSTASFQRSLNISLGSLGQGGRYTDNGTLVAGNASTTSVAGQAETTVIAYYQLTASEGQKVQVSVQTALSPNATLSLYRGLQMSDGLLITLDSTSSSQDLQSVVGDCSMLLVLQNFPASQNFTAVFTSVASGCDQLVTEAFGQLSFSPSKDTPSKCTWTIAPSDDGVKVLAFDSVRLGQGSSVKVYSDPGQAMADLEGPALTTPLPQVHVAQGTPARVAISQGVNQTDSVVLSYKVVQQACGGALASPQGSLTTPNFPNQYPLNAQCRWTDPASQAATPLLYLAFDKLDLAQTHSLSVLNVVNATTENTLATYMGSANASMYLPNDLIIPASNATRVQFSSQAQPGVGAGQDVDAVGTGARLNYWLLECGGNMTGSINGSFATPGYPKPSNATTCVWIVKLPPLVQDVEADTKPDSQSLEFKVTAQGTQVKNINKYLKIYDGPGQRFPLSPANATNGTSGSVLSRYDSLTVIFDLAAGVTDQVAFNLTFTTYVCNASAQCANGLCMHPDWVCNYRDDCGDGSDEQHCVFPHPTTPPPPPPQDYSGYVKMAWVPGCLFIGMVLGGAFLFIVPRIIRHFRSGGSGSYNRMGDDDRSAVA